MNELDIEIARKIGVYYIPRYDMWQMAGESMKKFSDLIRADEREACLKICKENFYAHLAYEDIRARGNK
jgi:hypothetical protein